MKRNLWKAIFGLLGFFILFGTLSCNNIISPKETTQVSISLDASFLQSNQQKNVTGKNIRSLETDGYQVSILLFQIPNSLSVTENQELDTATLTLLESITPPPVYSGDKVYATFNNVTIGIDAVIFVEIYENPPTDTSQNLVYKGNSKIFTVESTAKTIAIDLVRIENQETPQKFTVTFDANGGSFADGNTTQQITVEKGTPVTAPEDTPTYHDKTFEYWAIQQEDDSFSEYNFSQPVTQNITLYAQWREVNQVSSVHFNPTTHTVDVGTEITLSCNTPDASIYYTTDGSAPTTSSNKYTTPFTIRTETTIKAYAVKSDMIDSAVTQITYTLNQYIVQFVLNGGNFTEVNKENPISVPSGTEVVLKNYQPERSGYEFGGWYFDNEFTKPVDDSGIVTPSQSNTTSGTLTLYAKWEAESIAVDTTVTSFTALQTAITNASGTSKDNPYVIGIGDNMNTEGISNTITVNSHVKLVATDDYTITKTTTFAGINVFTVSTGASLTLGDANAGGTLTIDGGGTTVPSSKSLINVSGSLTLNEKSVLQNSYITSSTHGGAVYSSGGNITINGGILEANKLEVTKKNGGAIYLENGTFTVTSGSFITNSASPTTGNNIYGGALYIYKSVVSIQNAHFDGNSVSATDTECYGGAIYIIESGAESVPTVISNCSFTNNSAYQRGGAIYTSGESYIEINGCSFENNSITNSTGEGPDVYVGNTSGSTKIDGTQVTGGWTSN